MRVATGSVAVLLLIGATVGYALWSRANRPVSPPTIAYADEIDLGEQELGAVAVGRLTVSNGGDSPLIIDNVSTSCSCTGLEEERDGEYAKVTRLAIAARSRAALVIRVSVRGFPIGSRGSTTVSFATNDPARPGCVVTTVVARVKGGVHLAPDKVVFGAVPVGVKQTRIAHVFDDALEPRRLESVTSSDPARVQAELLPPNREACKVPVGGHHIADIAVHARSDAPADINSVLLVRIEGDQRQPDSIQVVGRFVAEVDVSPSLVVLPIHSSDGDIYEVACVCRSTSGKPTALTLKASSDRVTITPPEGGGNKPAHTFRISARPPTDGATHEERVTVTVTFEDGRATVLEIPVRVGPPRGSS